MILFFCVSGKSDCIYQVEVNRGFMTTTLYMREKERDDNIDGRYFQFLRQC